ncbi:MAG: extracellular solute-binding protein, partial [Acetobacteraceae bacterium]
MRRRPALLAAMLAPLVLLLGTPAARAGQPVRVLYAGSLVAMMEHAIGPAFNRASGDNFEGFFGGSKALANQIKGKLRRADVFVSSSPTVNARLMGAANGDWVRWYAALAQSPVVIGYDPHSRFAHDLQTKPWWQVLAEPGFRLGRYDPQLDPLGALILQVLHRAEAKLNQPGLAARILHNGVILPDGAVLGRLQSGQLDAAFFYSTETAGTVVHANTLPPGIVLSAHFSITIPRGAPDPAGAARFVAFLFGADGRALLRAHGLELVPPRPRG